MSRQFLEVFQYQFIDRLNKNRAKSYKNNKIYRLWHSKWFKTVIKLLKDLSRFSTVLCYDCSIQHCHHLIFPIWLYSINIILDGLCMFKKCMSFGHFFFYFLFQFLASVSSISFAEWSFLTLSYKNIFDHYIRLRRNTNFLNDISFTDKVCGGVKSCSEQFSSCHKLGHPTE